MIQLSKKLNIQTSDLQQSDETVAEYILFNIFQTKLRKISKNGLLDTDKIIIQNT